MALGLSFGLVVGCWVDAAALGDLAVSMCILRVTASGTMSVAFVLLSSLLLLMAPFCILDWLAWRCDEAALAGGDFRLPYRFSSVLGVIGRFLRKNISTVSNMHSVNS